MHGWTYLLATIFTAVCVIPVQVVASGHEGKGMAGVLLHHVIMITLHLLSH